MNIPQRAARAVIRRSFHLSVWSIEQFHDVTVYQQKAARLATYPEGTLGKDIADCLDKSGLRLVPGFESHDLKHVLLDFKMTPEDEIRMQAFMIGNGNHSPASYAIFLFGAFFLPDLWSTFAADFRNGQHARPISTWTVDEYAHCNTLLLRQKVLHLSPVSQPFRPMNSAIRFGAIAAIALGIFGMLFCLPFLFSATMEDLVGAGFPFVGGAIIAGAGLVALSNLQKAAEAPQAGKVSL